MYESEGYSTPEDGMRVDLDSDGVSIESTGVAELRTKEKNKTTKTAHVAHTNGGVEDDSTTTEEGRRDDVDSDGVSIEFTNEPDQKSGNKKEQSTLLRTLGHKPHGIKFGKVNGNI